MKKDTAFFQNHQAMKQYYAPRARLKRLARRLLHPFRYRLDRKYHDAYDVHFY